MAILIAKGIIKKTFPKIKIKFSTLAIPDKIMAAILAHFLPLSKSFPTKIYKTEMAKAIIPTTIKVSGEGPKSIKSIFFQLKKIDATPVANNKKALIK